MGKRRASPYWGSQRLLELVQFNDLHHNSQVTKYIDTSKTYHWHHADRHLELYHGQELYRTAQELDAHAYPFVPAKFEWCQLFQCRPNCKLDLVVHRHSVERDECVRS